MDDATFFTALAVGASAFLGVVLAVFSLVIFIDWIDRRHRRRAWREATLLAWRSVYGGDPDQERRDDG